MLEFINRLGVPIVVLTLNAVMDLAAEVQLMDGSRPVGDLVAAEGFFNDFQDPDSSSRGGAGK